MTSIPVAARRVTYAESLMQAADALPLLAAMISDLSEHATIRTEHTVPVSSEAEVDAAGAVLHAEPERTGRGTYMVVKRTPAVTITVAFFADPAAPAGAEALAGVCGWADGMVPVTAA